MPIFIFVRRSLPAIAFLPPLTPPQLRGFFATTRALSPPKRGSSGFWAMNSASPLVRDPRFTSQQLPSILPPTIPDDPFRARAVSTRIWRFSCPPLSRTACASRASPFTRRLAVVCDRIEFIIVLIAGWLFASGCFPPHLSVTQLPSATEIQLSPIGTFTQLLLCACGRTSARFQRARSGILPDPSCRTIFPGRMPGNAPKMGALPMNLTRIPDLSRVKPEKGFSQCAPNLRVRNRRIRV
jgi:hypothetical protein